ncbi:MAG TPA: phosphatase PAP2 family protein [Isosphaeraceae bacterium]|nr:phosphatase PAP2 family protein [Isosphaeraceae bacterium]
MNIHSSRIRERLERVWPLVYLAVFGLLWLLGLALGNLVEAGRAVELNDLDHRVWRRIVQVRESYPGVTSLFVTITKAGDQPWSSILVVASMLGLAGLERKGIRPLGRWGFGYFLWAMIASQVLTRLLKAHFARMRPDLLFRLVVEDSFSFPSGHSLTSACFCGLWMWIAWRLVPPDRRYLRAVIPPLILLLALSIAASRVWLGVHYLNDVLSGLMLGFGWAGLSIGVHHGLSTATAEAETRSGT